MRIKEYETLEKSFNMKYPNEIKHKYTSKLNFSKEDEGMKQRWYNYKEGFSVDFVKDSIFESLAINNQKNIIILDPFMGSGTTLLVANKLDLKSIGFEVNPFSFFLAKNKLNEFKDNEIEIYKEHFNKILQCAYNEKLNYSLPKLSISNRVFHKNVEGYYMRVGSLIKDSIIDLKIKELLKLGWLSCIEEVSLYRKAGNGLKKRTSAKSIVRTPEEVNRILKKKFNDILFDLKNNNIKNKSKIINDSCLNLDDYIIDDSIDGVIFSPPYANCFDYTEIYKLELWFGDFVSDYSDLQVIRQSSLRSHLNGISGYDVTSNLQSLNPFLTQQLTKLEQKKLWDKNITKMLYFYFYEMKIVLQKLYVAMKQGGFCKIVVGNSAYGGLVIPTDVILASIAQEIGFQVNTIEVDRLLITSSQQYRKIEDIKQYLRESVICLTKK